MSNPPDNDPDGVLRPFIEPPTKPLPPVEPPALVRPPDPPDPAASDPATPSDNQPARGEVPLDELVTEPDALPALTPDELEGASRWTPTDGDESGHGSDPTDGDESDHGSDPALVDSARTDPSVDAAEADLAAALGAERRRAGTVTLPRKPFLIGLGVLGVALAALFVLWQNAGDGDSSVETVAPAEPTDEAEAPDPVTSESAGPDTAETPDAAEPGTADQERIDALNDQLLELEAELADRPAPALPGDSLERVVVATDAKFVGANASSVAVVDPFGGLALINPENNLVISTEQVGTGSTRALRTDSAVWITNYAGSELLWVDPVSNTVIAKIPVPGPDGLAKDGGTLLVSSYDDGYLARVDPAAGAVTQTVDVGGSPTAVLNAGELGLWVAVFDTGELVQIDLATFEIVRRVTVGAGPVGLGATNDAIWVANHEEGTVVAVDAATGEIRLAVEVGDGPTELQEACGSVWVTVTDSHDLVQLDPSTGAIITRTPLGGSGPNGGPTGLATTEDAIWVAVLGERSVVRVDCAAIG